MGEVRGARRWPRRPGRGALQQRGRASQAGPEPSLPVSLETSHTPGLTSVMKCACSRCNWSFSTIYLGSQ